MEERCDKCHQVMKREAMLIGIFEEEVEIMRRYFYSKIKELSRVNIPYGNDSNVVSKFIELHGQRNLQGYYGSPCSDEDEQNVEKFTKILTKIHQDAYVEDR